MVAGIMHISGREMSLKLAREKGMLLVNDDHHAELGNFEFDRNAGALKR